MAGRPDAGGLIPGGTLDELVLPEEVTPLPAHGAGSRLWDVDGREYVDYTLGGGSLILGHAHPAVVAAVTAQARLGSAFTLVSEPLLALAERVVAAAPCAEQVVFTATGAEATYAALRLARAATGRAAVLKFEGGYHGFHDVGMLSVPANETAGVSPAVRAEVVVARFNDIDGTAALIRAHGQALAAVIVEPFQRVLAPAPGFLEMLRAETRRHGIVLVFDEVVTGFRFDPRGAQGLTGVTPDLATYGKVLGGGYPIAAVAGPRALLALTSPRGGRAAFSGSQHGNAVAAAAGVATVDHLAAPGGFERLRALAACADEVLQKALVDASVEGRVAVLGPVWHLYPLATGSGPFRDHAASLPADPERARTAIGALAVELTRLGVLAFPRPGRGYLRGYLSLAHDEATLKLTGERVREALLRCRAPRVA